MNRKCPVVGVAPMIGILASIDWFNSMNGIYIFKTVQYIRMSYYIERLHAISVFDANMFVLDINWEVGN